MKKFLLGMHYRYAAFKGVNCVYSPGYEFIEMAATSFKEQVVINSFRLQILLRNFLCSVGLLRHRMLISVLFKSSPDPVLCKTLANKGFAVSKLPLNPYLSS